MLLIALLFIEIKALNSISCLCSELSLEQECLYAGCEWITNTNQCINRLPINQPNCSDYEDQLVCDFLQGCAWNNQGKCEQFTQCSDYVIDQYDTSDQCYLKDQTCRNGQINDQGFITCQSIDQFCIDYTNELMTVDFDDKNQLITQEDTNQTAIIKFKQNSINNCIIQQNSLMGCSSIKNEIICKFVKNKYKTLLCQWINNQCTESMNTPLLNVDNCYLQSGGTHSWQNNICQSCKGQDLQKKNRILAELLNAPTLTQSTKQEKLTSSYEKVFNPTLSQVINCTASVLTTKTHMCFGEYCMQSAISKEKNYCNSYAGDKYDTLTSTTQTDIICSTETQINMIKNFNNSNSTHQCFQTQQVLIYTNGIKTNTATGKNNSTHICQTFQIMNSTTTGNIYQKCHSEVIYSYALSWLLTDACNIHTETIIQPDKSDSNQPLSYITSAHSCKQTRADQSPEIDTMISITTYQTSLWGETHQVNNKIWDTKQMLEEDFKSNFTTATPTVHNNNASFFNETRNTIHKRDFIKQLEMDPKTKVTSNFIMNETLKTEIYTFNYP